MVLCLLVIASVCLAAEIKVRVMDNSGAIVLDNFLSVLTFTAADNLVVLQLRDPVELKQKVLKFKIDGVEKDISGIDLSISTVTGPVTPLSPAPTPAPITKPIPPFPVCWWGPEPSGPESLVSYIDGKGDLYQGWADWLKLHPDDLSWAWTEYKKTNP